MHIEVCLNNLEEEFCKCKIIKSDPIVTYKETVTQKSNVTCLSKSANKLNRLYGVAEPIEAELAQEIESEKVGPRMDIKSRASYLHEQYGWEKDLAGAKLWSFGPENIGANVLVNDTK